jgi:hypothetical protein
MKAFLLRKLPLAPVDRLNASLILRNSTSLTRTRKIRKFIMCYNLVHSFHEIVMQKISAVTFLMYSSGFYLINEFFIGTRSIDESRVLSKNLRTFSSFGLFFYAEEKTRKIFYFTIYFV